MADALVPQLPLSMRHAAGMALAASARRLRKAEPAAADGDADAIHDMRVAIRRLRSALRVFDAWIVPPRRLRRRLRRLGRALGCVRDRDVMADLLEDGHVEAITGAERRCLEALLAVLREERDGGRRRLARRFRRRGHRRLARNVREAGRRPRFTGDAQVSAEQGLAAAVERLADGVGKQPAMHESAPDAAALHRLRIAFKRLRYALEFHADACGLAYDEELALARKLQDTLGALHDHDVLLDCMARGRGAFTGPWPVLTRRLEAERAGLLRAFVRLRAQWKRRTRRAAPETPGVPRFVALEAAPVALRLVSGGRHVASAMVT